MTQAAKSRLVNAITFARVPLVFIWLVLAVSQEMVYGGAAGAGSIILATVATLMLALSNKGDPNQ